MIPEKAIIGGVVSATQRLCPECNRRLRFTIQKENNSSPFVCYFWCETGDYHGDVESYAEITYTNLPWRSK
jgi:hypothetical protein